MHRHRFRAPSSFMHASGFTLSELLVVVLLIGLIASSSGTIAYSTYKRTLVEKAARGLYLSAKYARLLAVEKQQIVNLVLDKPNNKFMLLIGDLRASLSNPQEEAQPQKAVEDLYAEPTEFAGSVVYEATPIVPSYQGYSEYDPDQTTITFYPDGTADTAAIQVGDGTSHYTVYVLAATGKVQVRFGEISEAPVEIVDLDAEGL